jgi:protoporphyrinogen oxidase
MKIGVLGGGISGLSIAKFLNEKFDVEVLEKKSNHGGIARTKTVNNISYHTTGGHCFNSKYPEVLKFVFEEILPLNNWNKITRNAVIKFQANEVNYPIEFSIKEIYKFNKDLAIKITSDFLNAVDDGKYEHLEDWFRKKFGNTLSEEYFLPYNRKIWNREPKEMNPEWVEGKLPIPNRQSFFESLIGDVSDKMPHSEFYYPKSNNQNTFIDALAKGVNIKYNYDINSLRFIKGKGNWMINDIYEYDLIINTLPLDGLPKIIEDCPTDIIEAGTKLKYNKVTTMLWETLPTDRTWTYIPDAENLFHRYIHIGNFFRPKKNYTITEAVGERTYDEMVENGKKDSFLLTPLDYHISKHAYVVFDDNYAQNVNMIQDYLNKIGIHSIGRFGEWQYYNMDICIKKAMDLSIEIFKKFKSEK